MAIVVGRWTPDSCKGCIIEFDIDTEVAGSASNLRTVQICVDHQVLTGTDSQKITAIRSENTRGHGNVIREILDNAPLTMVDVATDGTRTFKNIISISWSWSGMAPNRVLTITVSGVSLTTNQKNSIIAKLDSRFGINNVILVV